MLKIFQADSQLITSLQSCEQATFYKFERNIESPYKGEPLEKGDLMHKMLEVYYNCKGPKDIDSEVMKELEEAGVLPSNKLPADEQTLIQTCKDVGIYYAVKMEIPVSTCDEVIYQFVAYCNHYQHDKWNPLRVEQVGTKLLYEDEHYKFLYTFKIDLVAESGSIIAPWDHKTRSRRSTISSLNNQFIGYCFALGVNHIVINSIGFQKTLPASERFQREILHISQARIEEWKENTIEWLFRYVELKAGNLPWTKNFTSCDKFSGCPFTNLCNSDPVLREDKILREYRPKKRWDPAAVLEGVYNE